MTTSNKEFHFSLLRISMLQLLKSQGFDKAPATIVDAFADLYVRFLQLLTLEVMKLSSSRMDEFEDIALQDLSQALLNVGLLKPMNMLDIYDENPDLLSDLGMQRFKNWCLHNTMPSEARAVATPTPDLLRPRDKSSKPLSMIPEYINQLDKTAVKGVASTGDPQEDGLVEQMINNGDMDDWIRFLVREQQLQIAKKISAKEVKDLKALPPIPGLKFSTLVPNPVQDYNEILPSQLQASDGDDKSPKEKALLSKMIAYQKGTRLENIRLSFEDDELSASDADVDISDVGFFDEEVNQDIENFEPLGGNMALDMHEDPNLHLAESENLTDSFQRKDYMDLGDDIFQNHEFDFNNY
ncbi:LAME_0A03466g1_1 [Lachancea meyersii CBS 8951]|uniref:LAME_0A03466g1_1 n=1 Tax=Lachancea meyersii CBS 8951 TaxID=1266667 RepID=A0A1G4IN79_9SACH|nr:LAME_0A03466g1_1 [Lachancea meyersii CBS 8951]